MGIKTKKDLEKLLNSDEGRNCLNDNLKALIEEALATLPRSDINIASESGKAYVAKHVAGQILKLSKDKSWWEKYTYYL